MLSIGRTMLYSSPLLDAGVSPVSHSPQITSTSKPKRDDSVPSIGIVEGSVLGSRLFINKIVDDTALMYLTSQLL